VKGVKMHLGDYRDSAVTLAEDLVNSYSYSEGRDLLDRVALTRIAEARGWHGPAATDADVKRTRSLRHQLREVFEVADEQVAVDKANALVERSGLVLQLLRHAGGPWHFHATRATAGLPDWLAGMSGFALLSVIERGDGDRLHRCVGSDCHAVFVDVSRNKSRKYCSPAVCGNRANVAAHRARPRRQNQTQPEPQAGR
jgi:predicted RNA-binding Zn ribbon-like protein